MTKLIAFAGKKQSGKTSASNFVVGSILLSKNVISQFRINKDSGALELECNEEDNFAEVDLLTTDVYLQNQLQEQIWPYVKVYSFSDKLKSFCVDVLGVEPHKIYGNNDEKNELTHINWESVPKPDRRLDGDVWMPYKYNYSDKSGQMTGREVMQYFGTDVCRAMYEPCWINATLNSIKKDNPDVAIICDCRYFNEFSAIKDFGGYVIKLSRNVFNDNHISEIDLDNIPNDDFDWYIDNQNINLYQCHDQIAPLLRKWKMIK